MKQARRALGLQPAPAGTPGLTEIASTWVTPRVDVLEVGVSAIDIPITLYLIDQWISQGDRQYICVTDVHAVMESQRDPRIRNALNYSGLTPRFLAGVARRRPCLVPVTGEAFASGDPLLPGPRLRAAGPEPPEVVADDSC